MKKSSQADFHAPGQGDTQNQSAPSTEVAFADTELGRRLLAVMADGTASNRTIAEHLLRNPVRITAWSIEDLAGAIGVSNATLSRFARAVGYSGYPDLRAGMAETLQTVLRPVEKLRSSFDRADPTQAAISEGLEATLSHLSRVADQMAGGAQLPDLVARLNAARTIYVMGFGLSAHVAGLLTLGLQPFCANLVNVVEFGGTEVAAGRLMNLGEGDVLIAIAFPRYAQAALHLAGFAKSRKAYVVAITDSPVSPLAQRADIILLAESTHPVLSSSLAAAVLMAETLVTAMMLSNRDNVARAESLTDAISSYLHNP
ncbi:MAG: MurR/RpiR family transcriptional regulator [Niveispirillum sp.]|uniref:MurR/RpiR family transcriptional regulator n=1 Tax=Niveispirillum sp. TaxID=1917217 RepID=UPI003BA4CBD2